MFSFMSSLIPNFSVVALVFFLGLNLCLHLKFSTDESNGQQVYLSVHVTVGIRNPLSGFIKLCRCTIKGITRMTILQF